MTFGDLVRGGVMLPVPELLVQGLHLATLTTHLMVMTILLGSVIFYAVLLRSDEGVTYAAPKLPVWMAFTINTGVAPLLFCQALLANFIYTSSILMAGWWLGLLLLLLGAYSLSYVSTSEKASFINRRLAASLTALLLLFVSFVFVCNIDLMKHPDRWMRYFDSPHGWILFTGGADTLLRWLHVILAALFHSLLLGRILGKAGGLGGRAGFWLGGLLLTLLACTGLGHYALLSENIKHWVSDGTVTLWLPLLSCGVLGLLFMAGHSKLAAAWTCGNLFIMVLLREDIRNGLLSPVTRTGNFDYGSLIMFLLALVVGGVALGYMLNLLRKGGDA